MRTENHGRGDTERQARKLFLTLMTLCGLFLAVGVALGSEPRARAPLVPGDLSDAQIVEIRDAAGATILSGEFRLDIEIEWTAGR